jgi:type II secretory pathway pseudopilin PulG
MIGRMMRGAHRRGRRRGFTLIEMLVAGAIMIAVGAGLWTLMRSSYNSEWILLNQNNAYATGRGGVDTLTDALRGLTALSSAAASDVTFVDGSGASVRYWLTEGGIHRTVGGAPTGGDVVVRNVSSLTFTYWSYSGSSWSTSTSPTDLSKVKALIVAANVSVNGYARQMSTTVRLRNL